MSEFSESLIEWFSQRPKSLQIASERLLECERFELTDEAIAEIVELCRQEADGNLSEEPRPFPAQAFFQSVTDQLRICSISNVEGINALAPKTPLEFGQGDFTVVYGNNGTGKSGYVRILKHICGARDLGPLHGNVYAPSAVVQKATISFEKAGVQKSQNWSGQGPCDDLDSVEIFDSSFGKIFVSSEDEVSYEPPVLTFFSSLISVCEKVSAALDDEVTRHPSQKPNIPHDQEGTPEGIWFKSINPGTTPQDIDRFCKFGAADKNDLRMLQQTLTEKAPAERASQLRKQQNHIDKLIQDARKHLDQLSDQNCRQIIAAKKNWIRKKAETKIIAESTLSSSELAGIGTDIWKDLWEAAREYSNLIAYKDSDFPNVSQESRCVLCHQTLTEEARDRFISFENFVKDEIQKSERDKYKEYESAIQKIDELPTSETLMTRIDAAASLPEEVVNQVMEFFAKLQNRKDQLVGNEFEETLSKSLPSSTWIEEAKICSEKLGCLAANFEDAKSDNREEMKIKLNRLQAKKWLSEHRNAIDHEVERLKLLRTIQKAKEWTNTTTLSRKKGELAEKLITEEFVNRFNAELNALGASQVNVELVKTSVSKGRVLHKLQLRRAAENNLTDILSDGERRVVSIAAFLADVNRNNSPTPLIFDDPISSLDQSYEEAIVLRLIELSKHKQIIVFTHRLSLLGSIRSFAKKMSIKHDVVSIRIADWGTGEPAPIPLSQCNIKSALNTLINEQIHSARQASNNGEFDRFDFTLKSICSDFRILLERSIEIDLLCGVVQRYQRPVNSLQVMELAKLNKSDCILLDSLMTKYSQYVHSQPTELPGKLPTVNDLLADMNKLKNWREEYTKRVA